MSYGTFPIAAAAYVDLWSAKSTHTHIVDLDTFKPLCRVKPESILTDGALEESPETATCPTCRRRYARLKREER